MLTRISLSLLIIAFAPRPGHAQTGAPDRIADKAAFLTLFDAAQTPTSDALIGQWTQIYYAQDPLGAAPSNLFMTYRPEGFPDVLSFFAEVHLTSDGTAPANLTAAIGHMNKVYTSWVTMDPTGGIAFY